MVEFMRIFFESTAGTITAGGIIASFVAWTLHKLAKIFKFTHELWIYVVGKDGELGLTERERMGDFRESLIRMYDKNGWAEFYSDCGCKEVNQPFADMLGVQRLDCLGKGWLNGISQSERQKVWDDWQKAIDSQVPFEAEVMAKSGKRVRLNMHTCWGVNDSRKPIGSMCKISEVKDDNCLL